MPSLLTTSVRKIDLPLQDQASPTIYYEHSTHLANSDHSLAIQEETQKDFNRNMKTQRIRWQDGRSRDILARDLNTPDRSFVEKIHHLLGKGKHAQFKTAYPNSKTYLTSGHNPGKLIDVIAAQGNIYSPIFKHGYHEIELKGFRLHANGNLEQTKNSQDVIIISYKMASMNTSILGTGIETAKLTFSIYDPIHDQLVSKVKTFIKTPLGTLITRPFLPKIIPFWSAEYFSSLPFLYNTTRSSSENFSKDGDWNFYFQFNEDESLQFDIKCGEYTIKGSMLPYGPGYGDIVINRDETFIRDRSIQPWFSAPVRPNDNDPAIFTHRHANLTISDGKNTFDQILRDDISSIGDYAIGSLPKDHSWDWINFSGKTLDGKDCRVIFGGVKSISQLKDLPPNTPQQGWVTFIIRSKEGSYKQARLFGKITLNYNPNHLHEGWEAKFVDEDKNTIIFKGIPVTRLAEDNSLRIPGALKLDYKRTVMTAWFGAHFNTIDFFDNNTFSGDGYASGEVGIWDIK